MAQLIHHAVRVTHEPRIFRHYPAYGIIAALREAELKATVLTTLTYPPGYKCSDGRVLTLQDYMSHSYWSPQKFNFLSLGLK